MLLPNGVLLFPLFDYSIIFTPFALRGRNRNQNMKGTDNTDKAVNLYLL